MADGDHRPTLLAGDGGHGGLNDLWRLIAGGPGAVEFDFADELGCAHFVVAVGGGATVLVYVEPGEVAAIRKLAARLEFSSHIRHAWENGEDDALEHGVLGVHGTVYVGDRLLGPAGVGPAE